MIKIKKIKINFKADSLLLLAGLAVLALSLLWLVSRGFDSPANNEVSAASMQATPDAALHKSLNINDLRRASYPSGPLKKVNDLGIVHGTHQYIVKFSVPADHLTEEGLMSLPVSAPPAGGYPVIVLCHGYTNPWSYSTKKAYQPDMIFYSTHGYAVVKPDFRGQGLSIPDGLPEGAYYSSAYNTDVLSLATAIKKTSYLNKDKMSVWGHSMGAYVALRAAVVDPDFKNVILLAGPVGYIQDMYRSYTAISDTSNPEASYIKLDELDDHGTPLSNPTFWNNVAPISFVGSTKANIQIHVGSADEIVPAKFSADLNQALNAANKKHQYFVYAGAKHGLMPERAQIWQRSLQLLNSD